MTRIKVITKSGNIENLSSSEIKKCIVESSLGHNFTDEDIEQLYFIVVAQIIQF